MNDTIDEDFDLFRLLGANCMVHLKDHTTDSGDKKVVIATTTPMPEGTQPIEVPTSKFSFGEFVQAEFDALSDRMQERLKNSNEWKAIVENPLI
jgi:hypothetical protein